MKTKICCALLLAFSTLASSSAFAQPADACIQGYVWREAFPRDHVCVTPAVRAQAARDNRMAKSRIKRGGGAYGPDTCIRGYVWREANPRDHVCVTPATRSQAATDNRMANRRIARQQSRDRDERMRMKEQRMREERREREERRAREQRAAPPGGVGQIMGQPAAVPPPPPPPPPTSRREEHGIRMIHCPVRSVRAEIITPLPDPWWQTPQVGSVMDTRVANVGGTPTLMCIYQAYGRGVAVMRKMPPGVRRCQAIRNGFRCR